MRNIDYVNKKKAGELNLPIETVAKVNDYFWTAVKDKMRELETNAIHIKEIGTFEVSNTKLKLYIAHLRKYIRNLRKSTKYTERRRNLMIADYKAKYVQCIRMREKSDEILNFKKTYKQEKNAGPDKGLRETDTQGD